MQENIFNEYKKAKLTHEEYVRIVEIHNKYLKLIDGAEQILPSEFIKKVKNSQIIKRNYLNIK